MLSAPPPFLKTAPFIVLEYLYCEMVFFSNIHIQTFIYIRVKQNKNLSFLKGQLRNEGYIPNVRLAFIQLKDLLILIIIHEFQLNTIQCFGLKSRGIISTEL